MKRIVFTVSNDLSFDQRMIKICTSLSKAEFDVQLIGFKNRKSSQLLNQAYHQERHPLFFNKGKLFYLEINIRLFFILLFRKADLISAVDMDTLLPAYLVSKIRNIPLIFDAHEFYSETSGLVGRSFEKSIWSKLEKFLIPRIKNAYTVNQSLADIFYKNFNTKFDVILNTPVLEKKPNAEDTGEHFYLYQGVLNKGRGLEELIEVFSKNNLYLKIAGEGPLFEKLQSEIDKRKIADRVQLLGRMDPNKLRYVTSQAFTGFNLIEGKGKSYYFSLSNRFFDYMHAEIPQIGMNFPEYKKINDESNISILINSFDEIEEAIKKLENDNFLYQRLKENTIKAKLKYNWSSEESKLTRIYLDLS